MVVSLDEIADHRIAEIPHLGPLNPLLQVFLLLQLKSPVYKHLLELLVGKVYNELLKAVVLESLEPVNV